MEHRELYQANFPEDKRHLLKKIFFRITGRSNCIALSILIVIYILHIFSMFTC